MAEPDLTKLGKYDVIRILGRGAMGTVYEGFDPIIDRRVAIKTVSLDGADEPEAAEDLLRFKREAQAAGRLTHPNIVGVYDYGETEQIAYIVMEYVEGSTLKAVLDKGERYAVPDAIRMMEALLAGLAFSHEHGVIHRDIKPANVMITKNGQVKLADFGVARIESSSLTQAGTMIGTPSYMSPEQFMGQTIDARTDIYSAGVMFYQILTGEKPFEGSITAIMHKVLNVEPPAPSVLSISVTPKLDAIVRKAMAKRPDDRFATAREFADALTADEFGAVADDPPAPAFDSDGDATLIAGAPGPRPAAPSPPSSLPVSPHPAAPAAGSSSSGRGLLIGGVAAALVIAGGGAYLVLGGSQKSPHTPTPQATQPASASGGNVSTPATAPKVATNKAAVPSSSPPPTNATASQQTATPAPAVTPQPKSSTPAPAAIEAKLASAIGTVSCTMASGQASDSAYQIDGMVGAAERSAFSAALASVKNAVPSARISSSVRDFTGPYCGMVSAIRDYAALFTAAADRLSFGLAGGVSHLTKGQPITVQLTPPSWASHLEIDYVSSNGQIYRLQPKITDGGGAINETLGSVGAPFGRDMIVAIASSTGISLKSGDALTNAKAWPQTLKTTLARITADGGHVATAAVLLDTSK